MEQAGKRLLAKIVDDVAETDPERRFAVIPQGPELSDGLQTLSMKGLSCAVNFLCDWIENTIGPAQSRETLAYMGSNDIRYCLFVLTCQKLGYQAFLPSTRNSDEAHTHLLKVTGCTKVFFSEERRRRVLDIRSFTPGVEIFEVPTMKAILNTECEISSYPVPKSFAEAENETVVIIHSSGTTGMPKPVYLTNAFLGIVDAQTRLPSSSGRTILDFIKGREGKEVLMLNITPFFHLMGLSGFLYSIFHGITALLGPDKPPSVDHLVQLMRNGRPAIAILPPSVLEDLSHSNEALACLKELRGIVYAGAPLSLETGKRLLKCTKLGKFYGSSEAGFVHSLISEDPDLWQHYEFLLQCGMDLEKVDDGLYEMVFKRRDLWEFNGIFHTFPHNDIYRTNDLFTHHPTQSHLWKYYGRADDVIVLSNGEKFNPVTMESIIERHPLVSRAVVVGQARFQAALLIEPASGIPEMHVNAFIEEIWPAVKAANRTIAAHGRVMKNKIGLASATKPFKRTPKGSTQRLAVIKDYKKEIDAIYATGLEGDLEHYLPETLDQASVGEYMRQIIAGALEKSDIPADQDFYSAGLDSLLTIQVSQILQKGIRLRRPEVKAGLLTPQTIYGNSTVEQLSQVVCDILEGKVQQAGTPREEKLSDLAAKYTADLPIREQRFTQNTTEAPSTVILTGSTGSLGTYLLYSLLCCPSISKVYCLNRSDAESRQKKGFQEKELHVEADDWNNKLEFLQVSFGELHFGLDDGKYQELLDSVDTIIHTAWKVDFNQMVDSFESHIRGVRRFVDFSLHSKHNAHLHFVSSVSTVGAWTPAMGSSVPEVPMEDCAMVLPQGYGESKHVGERICLAGSRRSRVATTIYRVGQIAGPTTTAGQWNPHEWLPTIIATSKALGKVPNHLGPLDDVDWIPVDTLASIITEAVHARQALRSADDLCAVLHLTNPKKAPWSSLIPAVQETYAVEAVDLAEWVGELEKIPNPTPADVVEKPGLKLLRFYQGLLDETSLAVALDVQRTQEASATMRSLGPISPALLLNWMQQWRF